jgi:hypothetical protein
VQLSTGKDVLRPNAKQVFWCTFVKVCSADVALVGMFLCGYCCSPEAALANAARDDCMYHLAHPTACRLCRTVSVRACTLFVFMPAA